MNNKRNDILSHYINNNFWWDLIVLVTFGLSLFDIPDLKFFILLKAPRI
jgi:hypothetical protein